MQIFTSYFGNLHNIPGDVIPIAICAKPPASYQGLSLKVLAPSYDILMEYKTSHDTQRFEKRFKTEILNALDRNQILRKIKTLSGGKSVVLLCYETAEDFCHRHFVAKWLDFDVQEFTKNRIYNVKMIKKIINLALTGHRPDKLAGYDLTHPFYRTLQNHLTQQIKSFADKYDIVRCHTGMALGADTVWGLVIADAKESSDIDATIEMIAHIPYLSQPDVWFKQEDKNRWAKLRNVADIEIIYDDLNNYPYEQRKSKAITILQARNVGMIDVCDTLFAVYDGVSKGGTANAIAYATKQKKEIIQVNPTEIRVGKTMIKKSFTGAGAYDFLSNMLPCHIELIMFNEPFVFTSAEAAYQAGKSTTIEDVRLFEAAVNGYAAKKLGRKMTLPPYWNQIKLKWMETVLIQKFSNQNPILRQKLMDTFPDPLEEHNTWKDTFWGIYNGKGENNLGKILERIRSDIRNESHIT